MEYTQGKLSLHKVFSKKTLRAEGVLECARTCAYVCVSIVVHPRGSLGERIRGGERHRLQASWLRMMSPQHETARASDGPLTN